MTIQRQGMRGKPLAKFIQIILEVTEAIIHIAGTAKNNVISMLATI